jgi:hypothetical protein
VPNALVSTCEGDGRVELDPTHPEPAAGGMTVTVEVRELPA